MREMPAMGASQYASNSFNMNNALSGLSQQQGFGVLGTSLNAQQDPENERRYLALKNAISAAAQTQTIPAKEPTMPTRRLVQVFISDPDENVPLNKSLLYSGEQNLTDSTDQELFFEIDIKNILDKHNAERTKIANKKVKERIEYLEPAKIRDLKMVVVTVAQF